MCAAEYSSLLGEPAQWASRHDYKGRRQVTRQGTLTQTQCHADAGS